MALTRQVPRRSVTPQGIQATGRTTQIRVSQSCSYVQDAGTPHPKVLGYILTRGAIGLALSMRGARTRRSGKHVLEKDAVRRSHDHIVMCCRFILLGR